MPKSAPRYELDKVRYPDLETCFFPILFSLIKEGQKRIKCFLRSTLKNEIDVQYSLLLQYEILEKLVITIHLAKQMI